MPASKAQSVALPAIVDLDTLDGLRDTMLDVLDRGELAVGCDSVERIATNGLIMLLSAAETARHNGVGFALTAPSQAMTTAIERLGLAPQFAELIEG